MEEAVGIKLFYRGAKKISLINEGILLWRRAEEILTLVDRTEKELIEQDEMVEGRIGIVSAMGVTGIAAAMVCHWIIRAVAFIILFRKRCSCKGSRKAGGSGTGQSQPLIF